MNLTMASKDKASTHTLNTVHRLLYVSDILHDKIGTQGKVNIGEEGGGGGGGEGGWRGGEV
jgi:hypothetical protein